MDVLNQYGSASSDGEDSDTGQPKHLEPIVRQYKIDAAPDISGRYTTSQGALIGPTQRQLTYNMTYQMMTEPLAGPLDIDAQSTMSSRVEAQMVDESIFRAQQRMFRQKGYANDPSIGSEDRIVGSSTAGGKRNNKGLRRLGKGDPGIIDGEGRYQGPWAGFEGETKGQVSGPSEEQRAEHTAAEAAPKKSVFAEGQEERTVFHGQSERDYQGRTYMHVPRELAEVDQCFVPKRLLKEWKAHSGGASCVQFIPAGHLLLSSGMDGLVKIFDTHSSLAHLRTYIGHTKAVRDISFAADGSSFLSSSYDSYTKLWDTETGQCLMRFPAKGGKTPNTARFYPEDPRVFLVGQSDKKIVQWDTRAHEIVQEYDQHLGAVNSLTFIDNNRRFVSTSDDKTMRVWEYGIPVVIKLIASPEMHSVPAVSLHPNKKWFVGQSMDNRIVVYSAGERIKPNRKKEFRGHLTAGFACQMSFSPDGRFVTSGDSEGQVWCWDWATARVVEKWRAHEKVAICTAWHPRESSRVATCSWDGTVKYWG
ncbi:hypothetical protein GGI25_004156 [Coemansia spiralis]|uniref:Pre-mRNA-processing factor 17 n=2 Tax=Coemansia TaxID=4863 RepID=A0A9W8KWW0_9FUNG|nr:WD40-repeat-containing domain protein [Coemansia spiralis]KAJ1985904.1 hypothetical protein EDC05_006479 [Coemansia umbellata]KAJ2620479.1 hypothetical protein GGI26_004967 [Coemansia sp. RSA 1358]KAJ2675008.1 hypothetical protein GGI25_004156 [Coemansia spiralis]